MNQLKDLHSRDMAESAKMHKYQQRAKAESDEEFQAQAISLLQKVTDVNKVTKDNIKIFKGKVKDVVDDLCKSHNAAIMASDSRKRKVALEAKPSDPSPQKKTTKKRKMTLASAVEMNSSDEPPTKQKQNPDPLPLLLPQTKEKTSQDPKTTRSIHQNSHTSIQNPYST